MSGMHGMLYAAAFGPPRSSALFGAIRQLECLGVYLRWLKTLSSTFQDVDFDGS